MELYAKSLNKKFLSSKTQPQKRLNISLLNILWESTNINIIGHRLQGKLQTYVHIFQLILITL